MGLIPKDIETIGSFEHFMKAKEDLLNEIRNKSDLSNKTNNIVNCGMDDDDIEICDIVNEIEKKEAPKKDISTDKNKVKGTLDAFLCKKELDTETSNKDKETKPIYELVKNDKKKWNNKKKGNCLFIAFCKALDTEENLQMEMRSVIAKNLHRIKKPELIGKNEEQKDNYYNQIKKKGYPGGMLELETFSIWTGFNVRIYNSQKTLIREFNPESNIKIAFSINNETNHISFMPYKDKKEYGNYKEYKGRLQYIFNQIIILFLLTNF